MLSHFLLNTSCAVFVFRCIKKRFIIPKDGNMEAKNISSSATKAQRENLLLEVVTRRRRKRFSRLSHRRIFHTLFYLCALFKRCNEASQREKNVCSLTSSGAFYAARPRDICAQILHFSFDGGKLLCNDYDLLLSMLFRLFILISQWHKKPFQYFSPPCMKRFELCSSRLI
jgi:hypothetical protein